uniref:NADH-ubiquinone oxidoreductase chain 4 n=1 Tax=Syrbatus sp. 3 RRMO-2024a TaxID=3154169 RepID=A0AAU7LKS0_9COLE
MMKFILMILMFLILSNYWLIHMFMYLLLFMFMFMYSNNFMWMNNSYGLGLDQLSFLMIMLELVISLLMLLASTKMMMMNDYISIYLKNLVFMMFILFLMFSSINLFMFYILFESSLIPMLVIILGWGNQFERLQAGVYLMFYMIMFSLPMMVSIFYFFKNYYFLMMNIYLISIKSIFMFLMMLMVFIMKMPIYLIHLWLPKAHVEASISGSMILAGILLKLGGYGLIRIMENFVYLLMKFNFIFISVSLMGSFFVSMICLRQIDLKLLIAYSSIVHMGLVISSSMTLMNWGIWGSLLLMIIHGLCSSGMFCLVNIMYERLLSRSLYLNKGMMGVFPSLSLWWFLLSLGNISLPPSMSWLSEIKLLSSLLSWNYLNFILLMFIMFFSVMYMLYLYSYSQNGLMYKGLYFFYLTLREILLLFIHWIFINIFILKSEYFLMYLYMYMYMYM